MLSGIHAIATQFVTAYGLPVVFLVFFLEGALIGKLLPTRALLIVAVLLLGASVTTLVAVLLTATVGATIGQTLLFFLIRSNTATSMSNHRLVPVNEYWLTRTHRWFDRWGLPALLVSNALPVGRGYLAIPVALSPTPSHRFLIVSLAGTFLYIGMLTLAAAGINAGLHGIDPQLLAVP